MTAPGWFTAIDWSAPIGVEALRVQRQKLPQAPGVYVFTNYDRPLEKNTGVLYVGKATSLFNRVSSYLVDPAEMMVMSSRSGTERLNTSLRHAGKVNLLVEIQQRSRTLGLSGIWVRWARTGSPASLESQLIGYLRPAFNTSGNL